MSDLIDRQPTQKNESNTLEALDCVDRQAAIDAVEKESQVDGAYGYMDTKSIIDLLCDLPSAPTADPVKHGRWRKLGDDVECSCCFGIVEILNYNYCPNCGAKMDGVNDEAD